MPSQADRQDWVLDLELVSHHPGDLPVHRQYTLKDLTAPVEDRALQWRDNEDATLLMDFGLVLGRKVGPDERAVNRIVSPVISKVHAQLHITAAGHIYLTDLDSLHGIRVQHKASLVRGMQPLERRYIDPMIPEIIHDGDIVILGKTVITGDSTHKPLSFRIHHRLERVGITSRPADPQASYGLQTQFLSSSFRSDQRAIADLGDDLRDALLDDALRDALGERNGDGTQRQNSGATARAEAIRIAMSQSNSQPTATSARQGAYGIPSPAHYDTDDEEEGGQAIEDVPPSPTARARGTQIASPSANPYTRAQPSDDAEIDDSSEDHSLHGKGKWYSYSSADEREGSPETSPSPPLSPMRNWGGESQSDRDSDSSAPSRRSNGDNGAGFAITSGSANSGGRVRVKEEFLSPIGRSEARVRVESITTRTLDPEADHDEAQPVIRFEQHQRSTRVVSDGVAHTTSRDPVAYFEAKADPDDVRAAVFDKADKDSDYAAPPGDNHVRDGNYKVEVSQLGDGWVFITPKTSPFTVSRSQESANSVPEDAMDDSQASEQDAQASIPDDADARSGGGGGSRGVPDGDRGYGENDDAGSVEGGSGEDEEGHDDEDMSSGGGGDEGADEDEDDDDEDEDYVDEEEEDGETETDSENGSPLDEDAGEQAADGSRGGRPVVEQVDRGVSPIRAQFDPETVMDNLITTVGFKPIVFEPASMTERPPRTAVAFIAGSSQSTATQTPRSGLQTVAPPATPQTNGNADANSSPRLVLRPAPAAVTTPPSSSSTAVDASPVTRSAGRKRKFIDLVNDLEEERLVRDHHDSPTEVMHRRNHVWNSASAEFNPRRGDGSVSPETRTAVLPVIAADFFPHTVPAHARDTVEAVMTREVGITGNIEGAPVRRDEFDERVFDAAAPRILTSSGTVLLLEENSASDATTTVPPPNAPTLTPPAEVEVAIDITAPASAQGTVPATTPVGPSVPAMTVQPVSATQEDYNRPRTPSISDASSAGPITPETISTALYRTAGEALPEPQMVVNGEQAAGPSAILQGVATETPPEESIEPPAKKQKRAQGSSVAATVGLVAIGAVVGSIGTIMGLASLGA